jgi:hypothetical protein
MSDGAPVSGLHAAVLLAQGRADAVVRLPAQPADAARSFAAMAVAIPPIVAAQVMTWLTGGGLVEAAAPPPISQMPRVLAHDLLIYIVSWLAFAVLSHRLAGRLGRAELWPRFLVTYNWCNVVANSMVLAGALPAILGAPSVLSQVAQVFVTGWAIWLEWFAIRVTLRTGPLLALYFLLLDQMISIAFALAGMPFLPR